jgi:hypothetical protein
VPKITECPQPYRNDRTAFLELLAAQRVAIYGYDPVASHAHGEGGIAFRYEPTPWVCQSNHVHEGGTSGPATAGANGDDFFETLSFQAGAELVSVKANTFWEHNISWTLRRPFDACLTQMQGEALLALRERTLGYGYPELPCTMEEAERLGFLDAPAAKPEHTGNCAMLSDAPGIASAALKAAKNAKPAPEPVLSIGGSEFDTAELLEALQIVRARKSALVKETPRGLMTVAPIDHRCGRWNEEV